MPDNTLGNLGGTPAFTTIGNLGRTRFLDELANPAVRDRLIAYTRSEVGGQGPQAQQAFMESIFNRAVARNQPLAKTLSGSYFPDVTHQRAARPVTEAERAAYTPLVSDVLGGSNVARYATGNASGTVGFAGGPQTAAYGGERYGVEGPDKGWWTRVGAEGPSGGSVGYTGAGTHADPAPREAAGATAPRSWEQILADFASGLGTMKAAKVAPVEAYKFGQTTPFKPLAGGVETFR